AASDSGVADVWPRSNSSRVLGSKRFATESLAKDTLFLPVSSAAVLDRINNGTHLRIGLKLVSTTSTQLRIQSSTSLGATLRFKPATDTAVNVVLLSKTPSDSTLTTLKNDLADYVI